MDVLPLRRGARRRTTANLVGPVLSFRGVDAWQIGEHGATRHREAAETINDARAEVRRQPNGGADAPEHVITPAISLLSAVEGTEVMNLSISEFVVPTSVAILLALFALHRFGTTRIGRVLAPVMLSWFVVNVVTQRIPHVARDEIISFASFPAEVSHVLVRSGFMDHPQLGTRVEF